jgi:hypothetical protein
MSSAEKLESQPKKPKNPLSLDKGEFVEITKKTQQDDELMEWWKRTAEILSATKISLAELKKSASLDQKRIDWWKETANKKQN